jgi:hypothetical protein
MNTLFYTKTSRRCRDALISFAAATLLGSTALADTTNLAPSDGSWQQHKFSFQFLGFTSTYSCDGLADKLKVLLLAAGARADAKSWPGACASGFGRPDKFARAELTFYTLSPVDPSTAADAKPVKGTWRSVTFSARSPRELQIGDCELVEQFFNQVLPMFKTQNVMNSTTCVPHQQSGSTINLKFETFSAVSIGSGKKASRGAP